MKRTLAFLICTVLTISLCTAAGPAVLHAEEEESSDYQCLHGIRTDSAADNCLSHCAQFKSHLLLLASDGGKNDPFHDNCLGSDIC